jgi:hypothetical protein
MTDGRRDDEVPRLPRGRWMKLDGPQLFRIGMIAILFVFVIVMRRPCADGVAGFVKQFDPPPDAAPAPPTMQLERLSEDEIKRRFPGGAPDAGAAPR